MQRQTLVPLSHYMRSKAAAAGMKALEVACGTGRFATFLKVHLKMYLQPCDPAIVRSAVVTVIDLADLLYLGHPGPAAAMCLHLFACGAGSARDLSIPSPRADSWCPLCKHRKEKSLLSRKQQLQATRNLQSDIGCFISQDNYPDMDVTCMEASPFYLAKARENMKYWRRLRAPATQKGDEDKFIQGLAEDIPAPDDSFDVVGVQAPL